MQKGFVTFEIILVTFAFALLMSVAVPNAAKILDKASLDYETKRLYSELRFLQAFDRSGTVDTNCMGGSFKWHPETRVAALIMDRASTPNSWKVMSEPGYYGKLIRPEHILRNGETISFTNDNLHQISFDSTGQPKNINAKAYNGTIILTSLNKKKFVSDYH